ncbi:response regulator transcription factor [Kineococcus terrestris]|uniref:response regulator transcription factor n=1 Tax=Kineococcus terrestris TaxID=2044856 RepID=UPI0034DAFBBD
MRETDERMAGALWPHLLDAVAAGDQRVYLDSPHRGRVVLVAEEELQRLEAAAREAEARAGGVLPTAREAEVLQLIAEGLNGSQVAGRLGVSAHTVAQHLATVRRKYGVRSSTAAVDAARRAGHLPG